MDKKIQNIYNTNYLVRNDAYRSDMPFQNMVLRQNSIIPMGPMPNIVLVDTNYLNRKREGQDLSANTAFNPRDNTNCKY